MLLLFLKWLAFISAAILFVVLIGFQLYKSYLRSSTKIETPNGISSLEEITLGGNRQWIFIRGTDKNNPVLLFLHGGPGEPAMGMASSRAFDACLINHFTIVHWDQLGAGKSYHNDISIQSMRIEHWIEDCNELIDYLRNRLTTQKVFLAGHSGGTILGLKMAQKYPEKLYAYIGVSQIVSYDKQQRITYNYIIEQARKSGNHKILHAIEKIGLPPYDTPEDEFEKAKIIIQYKGFVYKNALKRLGYISLSYLTSPEYSFSEGIRTFRRKGLNFTMSTRYNELKMIDFTAEIKSLEVPVYFIQGKFDMITPTIQVEEFYFNVSAQKEKKLIIFENSAHLPLIEEKKKYHELLISILKQNHSEIGNVSSP